MHTTYLRKVGGSVMLAVPRAILEIAKLKVGGIVSVDFEDGRLVIASVAKPSYTLDELLAQCDASAALSEEDALWLNSAPVGNEEI